MIVSSSWNWLWQKHDEIKGAFRFFFKGEAPKVHDNITSGSKSRIYKEKSGDRVQYTPDHPNEEQPKRTYNRIQLVGLIAGPLLFFILFFLFNPEGLSHQGRAVLAGTVWIAIWWMTEAIPIPATSLLPLIPFR